MKRKTLLCRLCSLLLAGLLCVGLLPDVSVMTAYAEGSVLTLTNVVIFVRLKSDADSGIDQFNQRTGDDSQNEVWEGIKGIYDVGWPGPNGEANSFSSYISAISNGKVEVQNVFPQVDQTTGKIVPYDLQYDYPQVGNASDNVGLITEVIQALAKAQGDPDSPLNIDSSIKLDHRDPGVLDNLTIILQGSTFNGSDSSYKSEYSGFEEIQGVVVRNYNAMPLGKLLDSGGRQGLISHEFLHTIGLRDLYRLSDDGVPVGLWDIMASVPTYPQYPLGYQRKSLGWLNESESLEVTGSGTYTLTAVSRANGVKLITIKTPLSESAGEIICLEYRIQEADRKFESRIPASGLIMYRVDTKVTGQDNRDGQNYIYVYRPGETEPEKAADKSGTLNLVYHAALGQNGDSYGSTDLSASFSPNTLYYSTGRNSGVRISELQFSGDTVTFRIDFAQYGDSWQAVGDTAATDASMPRLYADEAGGKLYLAYVNGQRQLYVKQWNAETNTWTQLGGAVGTLKYPQEPSLVVCGGKLYAAFLDGNANPAYAVWNGSGWSSPVKISTDADALSLQLVTDGSNVYAAYQSSENGGRHIRIRTLDGGLIVQSPMMAVDFSNPTVVKDGSKFYIAYTKFTENKPAQIDSYDTATGTWASVYTYKAASGNTNLLFAKNGRLYGAAGSPASSGGAAPALAVWDGTNWTETEISAAGNFYGMNLTVAGQTPYIAFFDNTTKKAQLLRLSNGKLESDYDGLNGSVDYFQAVNIGTQVYVALKAPNTNTVNVYTQQVTLAPDDPTNPDQSTKPTDPVTPPPVDPGTSTNPGTPTDPGTPTNPETPTDPGTSTNPETPTNPGTPTAQPPTLRLTPPSGYTDTKIYVDGVAYNAQKSGGSLTVQLPNTSGKIATMYFYNENGVPKGMYVWRLSYSGNTCTATALPGLQDLISYHGFSIRVQSPAGIRFKSGIDTGTRARLLSGGVDGYTLKEYGTMSMAASNLAQYPFVLGESKVRTGQSYWTENGVVNDRVLETVSGRYRFASVIINIPQQQYASDIAFRAYVILQDASGREVTVYGPYVTRSVYTVAQQVAAAGEFQPGSSGYQYVQEIIQAAKK